MELAEQILIRIPLWGFLSIPLFLLLWALVVQLKKHCQRRIVNIIIFTYIGTLFLAPVPASMFVVFAPGGYALLGGIVSGLIINYWYSYLGTGMVLAYIATRCFRVPNKKSVVDAKDAQYN